MPDSPRRSPRRLQRVTTDVHVTLSAAKSSLAFLGVRATGGESQPTGARVRRVQRRAGSPVPPLGPTLSRALSPLRGSEAARVELQTEPGAGLDVAPPASLKRPLASLAPDASEGRNENAKRQHLDSARRRETLLVLPRGPPSPSPPRPPAEKRELRTRMKKAFIETLRKERAVEVELDRTKAERARRLNELEQKIRGRRRERTPDPPKRSKSKAVETERTVPEEVKVFLEARKKERERTRERGTETRTERRRTSPSPVRNPTVTVPASQNPLPRVNLKTKRADEQVADPPALPFQRPPSPSRPFFYSADPLGDLLRGSLFSSSSTGGSRYVPKDPWSILEVVARKIERRAISLGTKDDAVPDSLETKAQKTFAEYDPGADTAELENEEDSELPCVACPDCNKRKERLDIDLKRIDGYVGSESRLDKEAKEKGPPNPPPESRAIRTWTLDIAPQTEPPAHTDANTKESETPAPTRTLEVRHLSDSELVFSPPDPLADLKSRRVLEETKELISFLDRPFDFTFTSPVRLERTPPPQQPVQTPLSAYSGKDRELLRETRGLIRRLEELVVSPNAHGQETRGEQSDGTPTTAVERVGNWTGNHEKDDKAGWEWRGEHSLLGTVRSLESLFA